MNIIKDEKAHNRYNVEATEGELMAMWYPLEQKRVNQELSAVGYDCWLQLNRVMETVAPQYVKEHK